MMSVKEQKSAAQILWSNLFCLVLWSAPTKTAALACTIKRTRARSTLGDALHCYNGHFWKKGEKKTSVRLWPECLGGWVGESMPTLSHKRPLFTSGSNDILTHSHTHAHTLDHTTTKQIMPQYYPVNPESGGCLQSACWSHKAARWAIAGLCIALLCSYYYCLCVDLIGHCSRIRALTRE